MRRLLSYSLCLAALAFPVFAQDAPSAIPSGINDPNPAMQAGGNSVPPANRTPQPKGQITGTVTCADTHLAARGATVIAVPIPSSDGPDPPNPMGGFSSMGRVTMDGTYTLRQVPPGDYSVIAVLPGYLSSMEDLFDEEMDRATSSSKNESSTNSAKKRELLLRNGAISVTGNETARFDVSLQRAAAVSGRILYSDGSPAEGITVEIEDTSRKKTGLTPEQSMGALLMRSIFLRQNISTDDQGHFRIAGIAPGTYRIAAVSSQENSIDFGGGGDDDGMGFVFGAIAGSGNLDPAALRVYAGNTLHAKSAKVFELRAGDEVSDVAITVPIDAFHHVTGSIAAQDGRIINMADLSLTDTTDDLAVFQTKVQEDGSFQFPAVPAGSYTLQAKEAKIMARPPQVPDSIPLRASGSRLTNAFADGSMTVVVKDGDVSDVNLALPEVPLPHDTQGAHPPSNGSLSDTGDAIVVPK